MLAERALASYGVPQAVARGFGFSVPPRVDLNLSARGQKARAKQQERSKAKKFGKGGGHAFSATNPYGKRAEGDSRQFVR